MLVSRLTKLSTGLRARQLVTATCLHLSSVSVFCLILALFESMTRPLSENFCQISLNSALVLAVISLVAYIFRNCQRRNLKSLALQVEQRFPDLMDSFVCAVEISLRSTPPNAVERELLESIENRETNDQLIDNTFHKQLSNKAPAIWFTVAVLATTLAWNSIPCKKWLCARLGDGIVIHTHPLETPRGSDFRITAKATRWENDLKVLVNGQVYPMTKLNDGQTSAFVFYDLQKQTRFKIFSDSLTSSAKTIKVFDPPEFTNVNITCIPPEYTGLETKQYGDFQNMECIAGSKLTIEIDARKAFRATLENQQEKQAIFTEHNGIHTLDWMPKKDESYRVVLEDNQNHLNQSPWFDIQIKPDLPPVIEQRLPKGDVKIKSKDSLRLDASAFDDFGIQEFGIKFAINGNQRQTKLFKSSEEKTTLEAEHNQLWHIHELNLQDGDIIACFFFATDNCQPKPQTTRADVFFITIQPDQADIEADSDGQGQEKKASVSDLIAEAKRLLRLTWDATRLELDDQVNAAPELLRGLKDLELEIRRREQQLLGTPQVVDTDPDEQRKREETNTAKLPEPFDSLFKFSIQAENQAITLVEKTLLDESSLPQEQGLTALVKIENELLKNAMKSKKGESEGQGKAENQEDKKKDQESNSQDSQEQQQSDQQQAEMLQKAIEHLKDAMAKQSQVNERASQPGAISSALAQKESEINQFLDQVNDMIRPIPTAATGREQIANAQAEIRKAQMQFDNNDLKVGQVHGIRAQISLQNALQALEESLKAVTQNQVAMLSEQTRQLAQQQYNLSQESKSLASQQNVPQETAKQLREKQLNLKQNTDRLKQAIANTSKNIQEQYPEAARELNNALQKLQKSKLESELKRAENALLYKRFDRANQAQVNASNALYELAQSLDKAAEKMPPMNEQELRNELEKLQRQYNETKQAADNQEKIDEIIKQLEKQYDNLARTLKDDRLNQLSEAMQMLNGQNPSEASQGILNTINAAARVLVEHLAKVQKENKDKQQNKFSVPPRKYQRLVEDYFKELGEIKLQ